MNPSMLSDVISELCAAFGAMNRTRDQVAAAMRKLDRLNQMTPIGNDAFVGANASLTMADLFAAMGVATEMDAVLDRDNNAAKLYKVGK